MSVVFWKELAAHEQREIRADALADTPELVNSEPYGGGWMIKLKLGDPSEVDKLLSASEYEDYLESQKED